MKGSSLWELQPPAQKQRSSYSLMCRTCWKNPCFEVSRSSEKNRPAALENAGPLSSPWRQGSCRG